MEETNVTITIKSVQRRDGEQESITQRCEGRLSRKGELWRLYYREGAQAGLGETQTLLESEGGRVTLSREGEVRCRMVFQPGLSHTSVYETPYGKLPMTIRTLALKTGLTPTGGRVMIHYQIQLGGADAGETWLRLLAETKENRE